MDQINIRKFQQNDAESAAKIIRNNLFDINAKYYADPTIRNLVNIYSATNLIQESSKKTIIVAIYQDEFAGIGTLLYDHISCVFVDVNNHHKGIGKKIMNALELIEIDNGITIINLHASINATIFYQRLGYDAISNLESEEFGKSIFMQKKL